jgi:hypothetical protein
VELPPDEYTLKQVLAGRGLRVPRSLLVAAGQAVPDPGFDEPYVVKVCSAEIQHKTERGGVRLGVRREQLSSAVSSMQGLFPGAGVLVEEQVMHDGIELIVGAFRDPELGPSVMVGAGGVLAELHGDVAFRLLPCEREDVEKMIDELVVAPVFAGYRGHRCVRADLVDVVIAVGELVGALGESFAELDLNPIVCGEEGLVILDAMLVTL